MAHIRIENLGKKKVWIIKNGVLVNNEKIVLTKMEGNISYSYINQYFNQKYELSVGGYKKWRYVPSQKSGFYQIELQNGAQGNDGSKWSGLIMGLNNKKFGGNASVTFNVYHSGSGGSGLGYNCKVLGKGYEQAESSTIPRLNTTINIEGKSTEVFRNVAIAGFTVINALMTIKFYNLYYYK